MIREHGLYAHDSDAHEKFRRLSALANSGTLTRSEWLELDEHLGICDECREINAEYRLLVQDAMPFLASAHADLPQDQTWDGADVRRQLLSRVGRDKRPARSLGKSFFDHVAHSPYFLAPSARRWIIGALAACLLAAVSLTFYRLGRISQASEKQPVTTIQTRALDLTSQKISADELLGKQAAKIIEVEERTAKQQQEVNRLQIALHTLEQRSSELSAAKSESDGQLQTVSGQRDALTAQLQQAEQSYRSAQEELVNLRTEHERDLTRMAALESKVDDLTASNRGLEQRLADEDRFLASDRDIRELMGARKLYIADVFDVDSGSRTRKPFGRVFYTQNKSLIFYAFDLDRQPGVKNASIFQVWGQKDAELTKLTRATNLGILYMDSETNRRWVLRLDDPKQLAEIDAVFVTVEPHVGSTKPSGKPLLYALLRKEANHP
jgi:hypothetical protein